jgi:putative glycerol-1-phosphate prenyltransferase
MLGLSCIFMDAGSGASKPIKAEMIQQVCSAISIPVIIGGGIENSTQLEKAYEKGANTVVIGNAIESNPDLIEGLIHIRNQFREKLA